MERFRILDFLGEGGMGRVYRAHDTETGRDVALKFLNDGSDERILSLFRSEVSLLSRLSHPNLLKIHDYFPPKGGQGPFFSMEIAHGRPFDVTAATVSVFAQICRGLDSLHARGILHRDLKPENVFIDDQGGVKILDYGVAGRPGKTGGLAMGTPSFMPPEAFHGEYDTQSDLFSLGVLFYAALSGKKPYAQPLRNIFGIPPPRALSDLRLDLPKSFALLIDRLVRLNPFERPRSARALLRYLKQNGLIAETVFEKDTEAVLEKVPWVARPEAAVLEAARGIVLVSGPTGTGRSRLLMETKLAMALQGRENIFLHEDLHLRTRDEFRRLHVTVREQAKFPDASIILEYDADVPSEELREFFKTIRQTEPLTEVVVGDFSPAQSEEFLKNACLDLEATPPDGDLKEIAAVSGGRPLLLLESLRQRLGGGVRSLPGNLAASCMVRVRALSERERRLLVFVVTSKDPVSFEDAQALTGTDDVWETAWKLQRLGLSAPGAIALAHPSLREAYERAFEPEEIRSAHRDWLKRILKMTGPTPVATPKAIEVLLHAFHSGNLQAAQEWKEKALSIFFRQGLHHEALTWCERLLESARSDIDRYVVYAYRANFLYRLGRYQEALQSYDDWEKIRPDDGTGLIPLRYRLLRGQAFLAWGKSEEARRELLQALAEGDDGRHAHHRPWHAQTLLLLATLDERAADLPSAWERLLQAAPLAEGHAEFAGEIAYRQGLLCQSRLEWKQAENHLKRALEICRPLGNRQVEATILGAQAMLDRSLGRLPAALAIMTEALKLSRGGGELLQQGTLSANLSLIHIDLGDATQAASSLEKAAVILEAIGGLEELRYLKLHRAAFLSFAGQTKAALSILEKLADKDAPLAITQAEIFYRAKDFDAALASFEEAQKLYAASGDKTGQLCADVGRMRVSLKSSMPLSLPPSGLPENSLPETWLRLAAYLTQASETGDIAFPQLWSSIERLELPETRADLWETLGDAVAKRGFSQLAEACRTAAKKEKIYIFKRIPEEYQMSMDTDKALSQFEKTLAEHVLPTASGGSGKRQISESRFRQFCAVSRQIVQKRNPSEVLERMMDAALEMTGAERGFVLVKSAESENPPLPGFEIKTARHMNQRALHEKEFLLSLSTVRDVVEKGVPLLAHDAQLDPRFQEKKSVVVQGLKSILVVPLEREGEVIGAMYLDHRYQADCFNEEDVTVLAAFASLCSLSLENARMMDELARSKQALEGRVQDQTVKIQDLETELEKRRTDLKFGYEEIIGQSRPMMKVFRALDNITETNVPVWIFGESGTGKELVAKSLHYNSARKNAAFVAENVSAISETLLESELFGHKKGAFTHADRDRVGLFEQADGGTLFLDEIADMSPAMQVKLLRVLQEGEVRPVGSAKKVKIDVRLVTASNKDLRKLVKAGKFREDLFYRINGLTISLSPLRERKEDIPLLISHLIERTAQSLKLPVSEVDNEAMDLLLRHDWPGNIRELEATLRNALIFARGKPITAAHLKGNDELMTSLRKKATIPEAHEESKQIENKAEKALLVDTLKRHKMNKKAAAGEMGVSLKTLYARMAVHNIPKKKTVLAGFLGLK